MASFLFARAAQSRAWWGRRSGNSQQWKQSAVETVSTTHESQAQDGFDKHCLLHRVNMQHRINTVAG
jgi:hypothetical protein